MLRPGQCSRSRFDVSRVIAYRYNMGKKESRAARHKLSPIFCRLYG
jgi:hypothetical protein